jgi:hypothetical protein
MYNLHGVLLFEVVGSLNQEKDHEKVNIIIISKNTNLFIISTIRLNTYKIQKIYDV